MRTIMFLLLLGSACTSPEVAGVDASTTTALRDSGGNLVGDAGFDDEDSGSTEDAGFDGDAGVEGDGGEDIGCLSQSDCEEGFVCASVDDELRCKEVCDPEDHTTCSEGLRCVPTGSTIAPFGWCEEGCVSDDECEALGGPGTKCIDEVNGEGSGVCEEDVLCDPLNNGCSGSRPSCKLSEAGDAFVCRASGTKDEGESCDAQFECGEGMACLSVDDGETVCARYCRVSGGSPSCGGDFPTCHSIDGTVGYCQ